MSCFSIRMGSRGILELISFLRQALLIQVFKSSLKIKFVVRNRRRTEGSLFSAITRRHGRAQLHCLGVKLRVIEEMKW